MNLEPIKARLAAATAAIDSGTQGAWPMEYDELLDNAMDNIAELAAEVEGLQDVIDVLTQCANEGPFND